MRRFPVLACVTVLASLSCPAQASTGAVRDLYRSGVFNLPWNANKDTIQAKYPGGKRDRDDKGHDRYCAASRQTLLKLPPPHQSRELCFLIGSDGTLASATAVMDPSLPSLLAIVNRCSTTFGDFDAVVRDQQVAKRHPHEANRSRRLKPDSWRKNENRDASLFRGKSGSVPNSY